MVFDPSAEEPRRKAKAVHELGQDLASLAIEELDERIGFLEAEIVRLKEARKGKEASLAAASTFFKLGSEKAS